MYVTAEEQAERDELVAAILRSRPAGISEYGMARLLKVRLGMHNGFRTSNGMGRSSLLRLEAAGRARCVQQQWPTSRSGFRRMWYLVEES